MLLFITSFLKSLWNLQQLPMLPDIPKSLKRLSLYLILEKKENETYMNEIRENKYETYIYIYIYISYFMCVDACVYIGTYIHT